MYSDSLTFTGKASSTGRGSLCDFLWENSSAPNEDFLLPVDFGGKHFQRVEIDETILSFYFKDDGISIPCKYTSYVAPMMSMKLHTETGMCREPGKLPEVTLYLLKGRLFSFSRHLTFCSHRLLRSIKSSSPLLSISQKGQQCINIDVILHWGV